jgi:hypothetical protein
MVDIDLRQGIDTADITRPGPREQGQHRQAETVVLAVPEPVTVRHLNPLLTLR